MVLTDDNHEAARIIKDLEERVSNIEEASRSETTPGLLRTTTDRLTLADRVDDVRSIELQSGTWGNRGWKTSMWDGYERP